MTYPTPYHTLRLKYSLLERLQHKLTGRWPKRVVERRLEALRKDEANQELYFYTRGWLQ